MIEDTDLGLNRIIKDMEALEHAETTVGFHGDDHYPNGTEVVDVAVWNEYGTRNSPDRPFMTTAAHRYAQETGDKMAHEAQQVMAGSQPVLTALMENGEYFRDKIQQTLLEGPWAPNAPSTVRQKGHGLPLVDTERMFNSVDYEVEL